MTIFHCSVYKNFTDFLSATKFWNAYLVLEPLIEEFSNKRIK